MADAAAPSAPSLLPTEIRTALTLSAVAVLRMFGLFMLLPVLAIWARDLEGATPWLIGVAVSAYGLSQAALQIPFGVWSDRIGRRPVVFTALLLFVAGSLVCGFAEDLTWLIIGRVLQGAGAISAAITAWLADATRPDVRVRASAIYGASIGASFALSLILGPVLAAAFSVRALFWVASGFGVVAISLLLIAPTAPRQATERLKLKDVSKVLSNRRLVALFVSVWALHALLIALFVVLPIALLDAGFASDGQWRIYLLALLASLGAVLPMLRRAEGHSAVRLAIPAWFIMGAGLAFMTVELSSLWIVTAGLAVFFAGFNFLEASLPAWVSLLAPPALRGTCLGVFATAQFFGAFCGGLLGAALIQLTAIGYGLVALGVLSAAMGALLWPAMGRFRRSADSAAADAS